MFFEQAGNISHVSVFIDGVKKKVEWIRILGDIIF
jgi:hypothetical protein